jgi:hypothetical protein
MMSDNDALTQLLNGLEVPQAVLPTEPGVETESKKNRNKR